MRARIGHCLDHAHVANAFFEIWARPDAALGFDGRDEIIFHVPAAFQIWRQIDNVQGAIARAPGLHNIQGRLMR